MGPFLIKCFRCSDGDGSGRVWGGGEENEGWEERAGVPASKIVKQAYM